MFAAAVRRSLAAVRPAATATAAAPGPAALPALMPKRGLPIAVRGMASTPFKHVDVSSIRGRHLDSLFSFSAAEIDGLLNLSAALKAAMRRTPLVFQPLAGQTMSMIFQKRSTRTRVSTETGIARLGGHALFLGSEDIQLGKNETLRDTARVLSRYNDIILARVFAHADITELCKEASVPVINALSDMDHPLQGLADLLTLRESFGSLRGLTLAWVGDGNNIAHTLLSAAGPMGYNIQLAVPKGYECDPGYMARAKALAAAAGTRITVSHAPEDALAGADVIVTDTWVSMGMEGEKAQRLKDFDGYRVTRSMIERAGARPGWRFLHCLPRKQEEVDDDVFYDDKRSLVWDEAENRMWTVMAVAVAQLHGGARIPQH